MYVILNFTLLPCVILQTHPPCAVGSQPLFQYSKCLKEPLRLGCILEIRVTTFTLVWSSLTRRRHRCRPPDVGRWHRCCPPRTSSQVCESRTCADWLIQKESMETERTERRTQTRHRGAKHRRSPGLEFNSPAQTIRWTPYLPLGKTTPRLYNEMLIWGHCSMPHAHKCCTVGRTAVGRTAVLRCSTSPPKPRDHGDNSTEPLLRLLCGPKAHGFYTVEPKVQCDLAHIALLKAIDPLQPER